MSERNGSHAEQDSLERLSDRELIRRFAASGENDAFALLLSRHAPMVFGVCRRILRHHQDAEDAFQATFLILATKAGKVRWQRSLANWLYTTASRVALKASAATQKRREVPMSGEPMVEDSALAEVARSAACRALDEELNQLPEKYRAPLVLCYLEGKSGQQAAEELGLSAVVVKGRLQRGRHELRLRLVRRGIGLSAAGGGLAVSTGAAGAPWIESAASGVPEELLVATMEGAAQFATSGSVGGAITAQALRLAEGELLKLSATSIIMKPTTAAAIAATLVGVSCLLLASTVFAEKPEQAAVPLQPSIERDNQPGVLAAHQVAFHAGPSDSGGMRTGNSDSGREQKNDEPRMPPQAADAAEMTPDIIIAQHVLLWDNEIVTWEEIIARMRAVRPRGPLHPTFHSTNGVHENRERDWQFWRNKVMEVYGELFEPAGVSFSNLSPRGSRRYDRIRTAEDLKPNPGLARSGRVLTPGGEPAKDAQAVVLPTEDVLGVALAGKRLRDPFNDTWVPTDETGGFTIHPEEERYLLAVLHESGFALLTLKQQENDLRVRLEPWATLTFTTTGVPNGKTAASVSIHPRDMPAEGPRFRVYEIKAEGEPLVIPVPAGRISVQRTFEIDDSSSIGVPVDDFDVAPGENHELTVDAATIRQ